MTTQIPIVENERKAMESYLLELHAGYGPFDTEGQWRKTLLMIGATMEEGLEKLREEMWALWLLEHTDSSITTVAASIKSVVVGVAPTRTDVLYIVRHLIHQPIPTQAKNCIRRSTIRSFKKGR